MRPFKEHDLIMCELKLGVKKFKRLKELPNFVRPRELHVASFVRPRELASFVCPRELVSFDHLRGLASFVHLRELVSFDPRQVTSYVFELGGIAI